jgi:hypothetical protein
MGDNIHSGLSDNASGSEDDEDAHVFSPSSVNAGLSVKLLLLPAERFFFGRVAVCYNMYCYQLPVSVPYLPWLSAPASCSGTNASQDPMIDGGPVSCLLSSVS